TGTQISWLVASVGLAGPAGRAAARLYWWEVVPLSLRCNPVGRPRLGTPELPGLRQPLLVRVKGGHSRRDALVRARPTGAGTRRLGASPSGCPRLDLWTVRLVTVRPLVEAIPGESHVPSGPYTR